MGLFEVETFQFAQGRGFGSSQMFFLHSYMKPLCGVQSVSIYLFRINEELT